MPVPIFVILVVVLMLSSGSKANANYDEDSTAAPVCPHDYFYNDGEISSKMGARVGEVVCRHPTDMECLERYGRLAVFSYEIQRCVWTLPTGVTLPNLQVAPVAGLGVNRCALLRLLHTLLFTMQAEGIRILPLEISGEVLTPLRCGRVDLQPWSMEKMASVRAPAVHKGTGVVSSVLSGKDILQHGLSTPVWVVPVFIILGALCAFGVTAVAALAWRIHNIARTVPPTTAVSTINAATVSCPHSPYVGDGAVSPPLMASSTGANPWLPPCSPVASLQTLSSQNSTITMPMTPQDFKSGNYLSRTG